ncbi:MAG: gamma-glutamyltransferase [Nitrospinota bacterium]|nr:MAG: gamma-glutamyltransferase [Nitrospinota bacterium]
MSKMPQGGPLKAHRPVIMGRRGVIATAHYLASEAGMMMFRQGGNAVDAIVAAAAALNVVEPYMSGLGGIGLALISLEGNPPRMLNFSGQAPQAAVPTAFDETTQEVGIKAPLVPGNPAGWLTLHQAYGVLSREEVFAPAIDLARHGYPVSPLNARFFAGNRDLLTAHPDTAAIFYPDGRTFAPGEILTQPALADSLAAIAEGGMAVFYGGELGRRIAEFSAQEGGLLTLDDLAAYRPQWQDPLSIEFGDATIYTTSPNSNGFQILETLNLLEPFPLSAMGHNSAEYLHHLIEAIKLAVTDRIACCGDPAVVSVPASTLISKAYADQRRTLLDPEQAGVVAGERATRNPPAGAIPPGPVSPFRSGETTHLCAADAAGTVVSITQTLGNAFGCGLVAGKTGILLNNLIKWFEIDPEVDERNLVAPGKRVATNMSPTQVFRNQKPCLAIGTPGSYGILQTTAQMLLNFLVFGLNVQEAIEAPRIRVMAGKEVVVEDRIAPEVRAELERRGHRLTLLGDWSVTVGGGQGLAIHPATGVLMAGADPRRDGYALGY